LVFHQYSWVISYCILAINCTAAATESLRGGGAFYTRIEFGRFPRSLRTPSIVSLWSKAPIKAQHSTFEELAPTLKALPKMAAKKLLTKGALARNQNNLQEI